MATFFPTSFPTSSPTNDGNSIISSVGVAVIIFIMFGIAVGSVTEYMLHLLHFPVPYVAFVFFEGVALALILRSSNYGDAIDQVQATDVASILILFVFLPVLLFGEVMNLNWHHIKGGFNQAMILAGPCALASALLTAVFTQLIWPGWRQPVLYYVFGAILCATDPVSVVALLKSTGASSKLTIVIVGESLMNDGTAMILFFYFLGTLEGVKYNAAMFFEFVSIKLLLSPLAGLGIGFVTVISMKRIYQHWRIVDMNVQVGFTLIATYSSFFVAQWHTLIDGSGVLSCCSAGLVVAWMASPKILADHTMHEVWGKLEWTCNTLIFLLGGLVAGGKTLSSASGTQFGYAVLLYVVLMAIRVLVIAAAYPIVSRIGLKCSLQDAIFMSFSGIRGALAIALALELKASPTVTDTDGEEFYFFICVIAALSLLINGSLAGYVLQVLGLVTDPTKPKTPELLFVLEQIRRRIRRTVREEIEDMREELGQFDNDEVKRLCTLMRGSDVNDDSYQVVFRDLSKVDSMLLAYVRTTFLETVRARYWDAITTAKLGTQSFSAQLLLYSIDKGLDVVSDPTSTLGDWECIERNLEPDDTMLWLATTVDACFARCGLYPGWVSYIDAYTERRAIYVLTTFIDAHLYAQSQIHMFLGAPDKEFGEVAPEEHCVKNDSDASIAKAKYLLRLIKAEDLTAFFNHRTARVVLILQRELIEHMVEEGALSSKLADAFLADIEHDHDNIDKERETTHRSFLSRTMKRKIGEEKERMSLESNRSSEQSQSGDSKSMPIPVPRGPTLRESLSGSANPMLEINESFVGESPGVKLSALPKR